MDMIVISDSKLKIMLTQSDMKRLEISCESIDYDNSDTRAALKSILEEVRCQTGVDLSAKRICIQVYPSREGGCEMFVNVLPGSVSDRKRKEYTPAPTARVCRSQGIYCFRGEMSRLIGFCAALKRMGYPGRSSLYRDTRSSSVYLVLDESGGR
ncbi:MAG: adaptor protein MecA, partial [Clostridia bacterium]|nr:adaptor protein MecA [Clostridia bacterium]